MELNERLAGLQGDRPLAPREEKLRETIDRGQETYFSREQERAMSGWEFLWSQYQYTRKRWWALQGLLLFLSFRLVSGMEADFLRVRTVGVIGCLFVVLIVPELWRNRENEATQVEAACLYSLRQIYAARITLFGAVDAALLTVFCMGLGRVGFDFVDIIAQFLLPAAVTAWICFRLLWGRRNLGEAATLTACLSWSGLWLLMMQEEIYPRIAPAAWAALFALALGMLLLTVWEAVRTTNQYWEAEIL